MTFDLRPWTFLLCSLLALSYAPDVVRAADNGGRGVEVAIKTVHMETLHGELVSLSMKNAAVVRTDTEIHIPVSGIVRITADAPAPRRRPDAQRLTLTDGDVLFGRINATRDHAVVVDSPDLGEVVIPLEAITRFDTAKALSPDYRESAMWFSSARAPREDRILLTNGDSVGGFATSMGPEGVVIDTEMGEVSVPLRLIVSVRFASQKAEPLEQLHLILTCRASGTLTVTDLVWSNNVVDARLRYGPRVLIEAERIARVEVVGGQWEWLSAHRPISYEHTPMLSLDWAYQCDLNVLGHPITVAGETFERGIGVHSRSSLTYDLRGAYREFVTFFGIDDDSGSHADVSVFVLVDGKRLFDRAHVRPGALLGPVRLDVTRAKRIELIVDFGDNGDLQDRFNWVETALIRAAQP